MQPAAIDMAQWQPVVTHTAKEWVGKQDNFTFPKMIEGAMHVVETYHAVVGDDKCPSKSALVFDAFSALIFECIKWGVIDSTTGLRMQLFVDEHRDLAKQTIETLIHISKNPQFIQLVTQAQEEVSTCVAKCRKRGRKTE